MRACFSLLNDLVAFLGALGSGALTEFFRASVGVGGSPSFLSSLIYTVFLTLSLRLEGVASFLVPFSEPSLEF